MRKAEHTGPTKSSRRDFGRELTAMGMAGAIAKATSSVPTSESTVLVGEGGQERSVNQACDLLIKGGTVIDPSHHLHAALDVAVKDGKILEVSRDFPEDRALNVFSAEGRIVTPGLIDLHARVFEGVGNSVNADRYCLGRGVTTVVDTGSAGYTMIDGFRKYVINTSNTRIFALVDIYPAVDIGITSVVPGRKGIMQNLDWMNPQLTAKAAEKNKPAVVGISVILHEYVTGPRDLEVLKRALEAGEASRLPVMAHIDATYSPLPDVLKMLRKGDVFSLCFNNHQHGILDANGRILPEVWDARRRGIIFDVGHAKDRFSFDVAEKCLQQGFLADTISTALSNNLVNGPVFDLPTMISKFMAIGMSLEQTIESTTIKPAQVFNYGLELGTLRPGNEADVGIFDLQEGQFEFVDSSGEKRTGRQKLVSKAAVCRGKLFINEI